MIARIVRLFTGSKPRAVPLGEDELLQAQADVRRFPLHGYRHATAERRARRLLNDRLLVAAKARLAPAKYQDLERRLRLVR